MDATELIKKAEQWAEREFMFEPIDKCTEEELVVGLKRWLRSRKEVLQCKVEGELNPPYLFAISKVILQNKNTIYFIVQLSPTGIIAREADESVWKIEKVHHVEAYERAMRGIG